MTYRIHCINAVPYLLFPASLEWLDLPENRNYLGTYNASKQTNFLDPLTQEPLYTIKNGQVFHLRNIEKTETLTDEILCRLLELPYTPGKCHPRHQIEDIQNNPLMRSTFDTSPYRFTLAGLYEIVEKLTVAFSYGDGETPGVIKDCLNQGYRFLCNDVTAIVAAYLDLWKVPLRIGLGYGLNVKFEYEGQNFNYFMDDKPGFSASQHSWIEIYLNGYWITFDPTIYFNKYKSKPEPALLEKYRETSIQMLPETGLYQWVIPDYMKSPYHENFNKTLLMMSGGIDSTALLVHLLSQTSDVVHVHHVNLGLNDVRVKVENEALKKIINYCRENYRPFLYTESTVDTTAPNGTREDDIYHVMYAACQVVKFDHRDHHFNRLVCGGLQIDEEEKYTPGAKRRVKEAEELFKFLMSFNSNIPQPCLQICFFKDSTKDDVWQTLPYPLQQMVWYCRNPKCLAENQFISCGECETCIHVQEVVTIQNSLR